MFKSAAVGNSAPAGACAPTFLADYISRPLIRRSAVSRAMSVERRHATHDERGRSHQHKKTHRFELSGHN
jgi:hypothetical protein